MTRSVFRTRKLFRLLRKIPVWAILFAVTGSFVMNWLTEWLGGEAMDIVRWGARPFFVLCGAMTLATMLYGFADEKIEGRDLGWRKAVRNWVRPLIWHQHRLLAWGIAVSLIFGVFMVNVVGPPPSPTEVAVVDHEAERAPDLPEGVSPPLRFVTPSSTSLSALELMEIVARGGHEAVKSQIGLTLRVQGPFVDVMIMPSGFDFKKDIKPSILAKHWMVVLEWDTEGLPENAQGLPKRVVYLYVDGQHEREVAGIPDMTEVIAIGTIQKIGENALTIVDATVVPL